MEIRIEFSDKDASRTLMLMVLIALMLALAYLASPLLGVPVRLQRLFDVGREASIPTWIATSQLLITGICFLLLAENSHRRGGFSSIFFPLVGIGFIFLSMDEASGIHESITALLQGVEFLPRFNDGHGIWIMIYIAIALGLAFYVRDDIRIMFDGYRREAFILATGMALFLAGGIGVEVLGYSIIHDGTNAQLDRLQNASEEFLELIGISTVLYAVLLLGVRFRQQSALQTTYAKQPPLLNSGRLFGSQ